VYLCRTTTYNMHDDNNNKLSLIPFRTIILFNYYVSLYFPPLDKREQQHCAKKNENNLIIIIILLCAFYSRDWKGCQNASESRRTTIKKKKKTLRFRRIPDDRGTRTNDDYNIAVYKKKIAY